MPQSAAPTGLAAARRWWWKVLIEAPRNFSYQEIVNLHREMSGCCSATFFLNTKDKFLHCEMNALSH
ncbi:MAG: hypothetical protein KA790_09640 [Ottowia sp.]|nr:hypothetical protein [Ottowia sp.]HRL37087.1 hypothetical protein [Ottowia beijingensis]